MGKYKEVHGLFKVPDSAIIENQAKEIGMLKSEIDELKYELEELKKLTNCKSKLSIQSKLERQIKHAEKLRLEREYFRNELKKHISESELQYIYDKLNKHEV